MPSVDVTDILSDPDFATTFDVIRRTQTVNAKGRAENSETLNRSVVGVVVPASGSKMVRTPEGTMQIGDIKVITSFDLTDGTGENDCDVVVWKGNRYNVINTNDYSEYGRGFIEATAMLAKLVSA